MVLAVLVLVQPLLAVVAVVAVVLAVLLQLVAVLAAFTGVHKGLELLEVLVEPQV
jgi:hypothetical protein